MITQENINGVGATTHLEPIIQLAVRWGNHLQISQIWLHDSDIKAGKCHSQRHKQSTSHWPKWYYHLLKDRVPSPFRAWGEVKALPYWERRAITLRSSPKGINAPQARPCRSQGQWQPRRPLNLGQTASTRTLLPNTHPPLPDMAAAAPDPAPSPRQN